METVENIRRRFEAPSPNLGETSHRLFVASETLPLGDSGVTPVSMATGFRARPFTVVLLNSGRNRSPRAVRRPSGGRKPSVEFQDGLEEALDAFVANSATSGR
ncbi:MAG: hypothetical protein OXF56_18535 [Rhodobacteraceae bacterium]|nr:hypothetical protein [Paracoccaceae bacterium]